MGTLEESRDSSQVQDTMGHLGESENGMKCGNYIFRLHRIKDVGVNFTTPNLLLLMYILAPLLQKKASIWMRGE